MSQGKGDLVSLIILGSAIATHADKSRTREKAGCWQQWEDQEGTQVMTSGGSGDPLVTRHGES